MRKDVQEMKRNPGELDFTSHVQTQWSTSEKIGWSQIMEGLGCQDLKHIWTLFARQKGAINGFAGSEGTDVIITVCQEKESTVVKRDQSR